MGDFDLTLIAMKIGRISSSLGLRGPDVAKRYITQVAVEEELKSTVDLDLIYSSSRV